MPSATGDSDKTSLDVNNVTSKNGKISRNPLDHIKSFEVAVVLYKEDPNEKNMANIDKALQILDKISDQKLYASNTSFLSSVKWMLMANPTSGTSLSILLKLVKSVPSVRALLRDRLGLAPALTQLLSAVSATNHSRISKILDLLRYIMHGIQILSQEAYLYDLIPKLLSFINSKDTTHLAASLSILICLCENYLIKSYLLSIISEEDRKNLFAKCRLDQKLEVLNDCLDLSLSSANLSSISINKLSEKIEIRLTHFTEVFGTAYTEDDCPSLMIINNFLRGLITTNPDLKIENVSQTIQQVFIGADYSEESEADELLFVFVRNLIRFAGDIISITEIVTKSVAARLDSRIVGTLSASQAVLLLNDILIELEQEKNEISSTSLQNIRLQLDTVVPSLCDVITSIDSMEMLNDENVDTVAAVLDTLISVARTENWTDLVSKCLSKPGSIIDNLKKVSKNGQERCVGFLMAKVFKLSELYTTTSSTWEHFLEDFLSDGAVTSKMTACLRSNCHPQSTADIIQFLARCRCPNDATENADDVLLMEKLDLLNLGIFDKEFDLTRVNETLDDCVRVLGKTGSSEELVTKTLELNDIRMTSQLRQLESLKASLAAADERISRQNIQALLLETEASNSRQLNKALWQKIDVTLKELSDVRKQFRIFQDEAASFRRRVSTELVTKEQEVSDLIDIKDKLIVKATKYKEQNNELQSAIKQHQTIRDELDEKLKQEAKISQDLTITLNKREEKLRKKERQLEEEMSEREKFEKEVDRLSKEVASLQSLTKRQEQALSKKDKQLQENSEELNQLRHIHEQIEMLTKFKAAKK